MQRTAVVILVALNLAAGAWSLAKDGVTPSWIVYPLLLLLGLAILRRSASSALAYLGGLALLFLLVHVPFLRAAVADTCIHPADASRPCHPVTWLVTLGAVPAATALAAALVWAAARRTEARRGSPPVAVSRG